jgi:hypothetical protein
LQTVGPNAKSAYARPSRTCFGKPLNGCPVPRRYGRYGASRELAISGRPGMIASNHSLPLGTRITVINTPSFACRVSTAKEGTFKGQSTMICQGEIVDGRFLEVHMCGKVIYSQSLGSSDRLQLHDGIVEALDEWGEQGSMLGDALQSVFAELKERGVAVEAINVATRSDR